MSIRERLILALAAGVAYAAPDVSFFVYTGFAGLVHSVLIGAGATALLYSRAPTWTKVLSFPIMMLAYCSAPIVVDAMWQRWESRVRLGYAPEVSSFIGDLGFNATPFGFRAVYFLVVTSIIAVLTQVLRKRW